MGYEGDGWWQNFSNFLLQASKSQNKKYLKF